MTYLEQALKLHEQGLRTIPVNADKSPACKWRPFIEEQSKEDIQRIFRGDHWGIALLCGNGIEALDIDLKYDNTGGQMWRDFLSLVLHDKLGDDFTSKAFIQTTTNNGYHYIFKSNFEDGNKKLASRNATADEAVKSEKIKVLFETRGKGGYVIIAPTEGYKKQSGSLLNLEVVKDSERNFVFDCARSFNSAIKLINEKPKAKQKQISILSDDITPWDDYNNRNDGYSIQSILEGVGWTVTHSQGERIYLRRPAKKSGISGDISLKLNLFKSFSTSTEFEAEKGYTPFAVYAMVKCNGDFSEAAKQIYNEGYGSRFKKEPQPLQEAKQKAKEENKKVDLFAKVLSNKFDYDKPIEQIKTCFNYVDAYTKHQIGSFGTIGGIVGEQKSRKTTVLKSIIASGLGFSQQLNFNFDLGDKNIVYLDTEQPYNRFQMVCRDIMNMASIRGNDKRFNAYGLRSFNRSQRVEFINYLTPQFDNIGLIVIDGIVDICLDYMDSKKSQDTLELMMHLADKTGAMVIGVLHLTKGGMFPRGHLGTEFQNKVDWMIETKKNEDFSTVKCRESRFAEFPSFDITNDKDGLPILMSKQEAMF